LKIILAEYVDQYKIRVNFNDGTEGEVDLEDDLNKYKDTKFYALTSVENFKNFKINDNGDLEWYNGWDYCKDTIYMKLKGVNVEDENDVIKFLKTHSIAM
jgi:hypothetical protein